MNYYDFQVVFQEVPGEISLCFTICGCPIRCKGCHSSHLWNKENGELLTYKKFKQLLLQYDDLATCVVFMGGEWHEEELLEMLKIAKRHMYKTCLYTGQENVSRAIRNELNWIKTGKWVEELGGLSSKNTNQKFIDVKTNTIKNNLFIKT
ncbi:anaerobic ribonucleoside-triphosphate reductase activating protein [Yeosuana marina]|uniref:anaerobic ribonucleoside-triphosphate reductase activating protein n=1 Tax=Yeosuana marina TaxID=1565536 RepID=UPI0030EB12B4|tara:strand:- start:2711 stop:3160 length:450 start_codon:yes stop_codon:yes gene_type:complete